MYWAAYICFFAAIEIKGDNVVGSFSRRLRTSTTEHSTLSEIISTLDEASLMKNNENIGIQDNPERLKVMRELLEAAVTETIMSFNPTEFPSSHPMCDHSTVPSQSPTDSPSDSRSNYPSNSPSDTPSNYPSDVPSDSASDIPSSLPSKIPIISPILTPTTAFSPSAGPTIAPSAVPSIGPIDVPSTLPSVKPSSLPVVAPVPAPTTAPVGIPVVLPVQLPVVIPTTTPSLCPGITDEERIAQILAILDAVADEDDIRNNNTPQGLATTWIIDQDEYNICPDNPKLVQRWTLAVMYFSTNGDAWFQCSANPVAIDLCGVQSPFEGEDRFLSSVNECEWAGITCIDACVTEIEFGTIVLVVAFVVYCVCSLSSSQPFSFS
jgi:hypothetical protein